MLLSNGMTQVAHAMQNRGVEISTRCLALGSPASPVITGITESAPTHQCTVYYLNERDGEDSFGIED